MSRSMSYTLVSILLLHMMQMFKNLNEYSKLKDYLAYSQIKIASVQRNIEGEHTITFC